MSIYIKENEYYDEDYDMCGNTTVAVLTIDGIRIPLCRSCLEELKEELKNYEV